MALKGRVDFVVKSNPFGGGKDKGRPGKPPLTEDGELDRKAVAKKVSMAMKAMGAKKAQSASAR